MNLLKLLPLLLLLSTSIYSQDAAREWTVQMTATVNEDPASITLNWLPNSNETPNTYYVFRKEKGTNGWGTALALLDSDILTYTDETAAIGVSYEYYVQLRLGGTIYGWGFINSGINLQLDPNKGDLLLIVDETFETSLEDEIAILVQDLYSDGWMITTIYSNPTDTPQDLKEEITTYYESLPNLKALYLLGNIPVPYSGELYPDAHDNHIGAWPADVYYGDIDGDWTDTDVNNISASSSRNHNIPGDGKFDQSKIPSKMELQVSRVDFNDLPVYGETEEELLQNYLNKAHEFKTAEYVPSERGLVDQGTFTGLAEGFAQNGFRNFTAFFGSENIDHVDYWTNLNGNDYLWSYGCGGGSYTSVAGLNDGGSLTSAGIAAGYSESTFTMLFGSYFGDWDVTNNLMRTAVANGRTLACSWAARPNWYYHNMAMGENLGYSTLLSQDIDGDYISLILGDGTFVTGEGVHVNQLGDPSLRMYYLAPPSNVIVANDVSNAELSWTASADGSIEGYNIYRRGMDELWSKLNTEIVTTTSFTDIDLPGADEYEYLVKSVKLKTNSSGTFYNESLGAIAATTFYTNLNAEIPLEFKVYPNPSQGIFTVQTSKNMDQITIQSIAGTVVYTKLINAAHVQVQLEDL
ncbi:MAG: hypothetical protein ACI8ZM_005277, partial [Crocinitomix sp.]